MNTWSRAAAGSLLVAAALVVSAPATAQVLKQPLKPISGLSLAPALVPPVIPAGTVHDQPITLAFQVKNLKAGTSARVTSFEPTRTGCTFRVASALPAPTATVGSNGIASFSVPGMFSNSQNTLMPTNYVGPCTLVAKVEATSSVGQAIATVFVGPDSTLSPPRTQMVTDTSSWLPKLRFSLISGQGTCSGYSQAIGAESYRVGLIENDGSGFPPPDITFTIRSGPTGTGCTWRSQPMVLPASMRLTQINAILLKSSKCSALVNGITPASVLNLDNISLRSSGDPLLFSGTANFGAAVAPNPQGAGLYTSFLGSFTVNLKCDSTLVNDHHVTLTLDSLLLSSAQAAALP